ncbi:MAG TPA: protein kinase [Polyangiaceae bacterium]|nr:protein kinase [Polyangiaceae bacterium]
MLLTVPLLVALVGVSLTIVGQNALGRTSLSMARDRFVEQTTFVSQRMGQALEQAEPVLDRMRELGKDRSSSEAADSYALVLRDLIAGRAGMSQAYVGFPDGTFQGVYIADDGILRFQESRVGAGAGKFHHYRFGPASMTWERDEPTDYDPRKRAWWSVALKEGKRTWTPPYPFFTTLHTGVTRVEPILGPKGEVKSVIAVDFDVSALSSFMARADSTGVHALVFADDGVVLAYPSAAARIAKLKPTSHALDYKDIDDPLLNAFFGKRPEWGQELRGDFARFECAGESMLATVAPIGGDTGPHWNVAVLVSEQSFLRALNMHRRTSLLIGALALVAGVIAGWFFARNIVRARRAVAIAREEAERATRKATELGSYTLVECLGKGGMGEVWRAEHRLLARHAAIKLINIELTRGQDSAQIQERFKREAQTIASLRSRNTVELFDYGVTGDGTFFFVMELLDGIDLETLTERHGPQPASRVVQLLIQVCNSLAEAHDAGLVHRDIKPANILVCRAADEVDVVKVLDFGLVLAPAQPVEATPAHPTAPTQLPAPPSQKPPGSAESSSPTVSARLTAQGSYLGTPTFIAPEQALGLEVDARADIYALGCVGWWLLTGELVFPTNDPTAALVAHMTEIPRPLRPLVPGPLPEALEAVIVRCLAKEPKDRPASAREIAQILRGIAFESGEVWTSERGQSWWRELRSSAPPPRTPAHSGIGVMDTILSEKPTRRPA